MTDDLVKRLRQLGEGAYIGAVSDDRKTARAAADRIEKLEAALVRTFNNMMEDGKRIEKLEAALRDIIDERGICGHCGQLATGEGKRSFVICDKTVLGFKGPCHWTPQDPKDIARKALEEKDD